MRLFQILKLGLFMGMAPLLIIAQRMPPNPRGDLDSQTWSNPLVLEGEAPLSLQPSSPRMADAWSRFQQDTNFQGRILWDSQTGLPGLIEGQGPLWIPPPLGSAKDIPLTLIASKARAFIRAHPILIPVVESELVLRPGASGGLDDTHQVVEFGRVVDGVTVESARLVFRPAQEGVQ